MYLSMPTERSFCTPSADLQLLIHAHTTTKRLCGQGYGSSTRCTRTEDHSLARRVAGLRMEPAASAGLSHPFATKVKAPKTAASEEKRFADGARCLFLLQGDRCSADAVAERICSEQSCEDKRDSSGFVIGACLFWRLFNPRRSPTRPGRELHPASGHVRGINIHAR